MAKKGVLILSIISIAFIAVSFIVPFSRTGGFWIAFVFGLVALFFQIITWMRALGREGLKSKFLGLPIIQIAAIYLVIQLLFSIIIMCFSSAPTWLALIVSILLLVSASVGVISGEVTRELISNIDERVENKRNFITELLLEVGALVERETNSEKKKALETLLDTIRYSDPVGSEHTVEIEEVVNKRIDDLKRNGTQDSLVEEIKALINERNQRCKAYK